MKKEFNLSEKIHQHPYEYHDESTYLNVKDVKEFIRLLKEKLCMYGTSGKEAILCRNCSEIDEVAGKDLK